MADEKTRALTGPRQLKTMVGEYTGTFDPATGFPAYGTWKTTGTPNNAFYAEEVIDVNLSLDRLTFFPESMFLQDPGIYTKTVSIIPEDPTDSFVVVDIVAVKSLDVATVVTELFSPKQAAPGMIGTTDDFNQIIMGTWRMMANNTQISQSSNILSTISSKDFSSASAFAQDTLHCYRIIIPRATDLTGMACTVPASRFIIQGMIAKEDELPYMMRLKNSYELYQG
tara:strand:- start:1159 stop:1836 length:678 start_codon:yes stop_codon:yes gene_type:complete